MRRVAPIIARAAGRLSRRAGRGGGTTLPGVVLLKLHPGAVCELSQSLTRGSVVLSGTNGKTTTARLLRSIVDAQGWPVAANTAGSNLLRGIATALLDAPRGAELGLFEVDEAALPQVSEQIQPRVVVLMNLFRDQLDRYGELESIASNWRRMVEALPDTTTLVLNADDPTIAHLGEGHAHVVYFGLDDPEQGRGSLAHATDSSNCPHCDRPLHYDLVTIAHMGHWQCRGCGLRRPDPAIRVRRAALRGLDGIDIELTTPPAAGAAPGAEARVSASLRLAGLHNAYNAAAAVAAAHALGIGGAHLGPALEATGAAFGRGEKVELDGVELLILLAKNPAGANENVATACASGRAGHVLMLLNDRTADGHDVSWIWDVDYEPLVEQAASLTLSGDRAHDLALRLLYGGCARNRLVILPAVAEALDHVIASTSAGETVVALPTYTAMLDLRAELVRRGVAHAFWEDR